MCLSYFGGTFNSICIPKKFFMTITRLFMKKHKISQIFFSYYKVRCKIISPPQFFLFLWP
ncbi:unnamed protein product [Meloidogyne enterolobii]|uniref:Uncharacterized protein n=1 Tax=Meloidogyne enterolobii TaxID=390850 RepID=A0ACB0YZB5_MELEN